MHPFHYVCPGTIDAALVALEEHPNAAIMAGGQSLVLAMRRGERRPTCVIDISRLPDLSTITEEQGILQIGALCTHHDVARSPIVQRSLPGLANMVRAIADPAIRRKGTIGGAMVQNDALGDYPPALVALDAVAETSIGDVSASDISSENAKLFPCVIVFRIRLTTPQLFGYCKFRVSSSGNALAGVAVARCHDRVRVAVTGIRPQGVFRWFEAENRLNTRFHEDALAGLTLSPNGLIEDLNGDAGYRAHLVDVMLRRALEATTVPLRPKVSS